MTGIIVSWTIVAVIVGVFLIDWSRALHDLWFGFTDAVGMAGRLARKIRPRRRPTGRHHLRHGREHAKSIIYRVASGADDLFAQELRNMNRAGVGTHGYSSV